ncbi:hypothetical protein M3F30_05275 [Corynebacterium sanguinis]|uniref:hypothetical protein n=1 Tax=Corynebacterium sanguinis TaxID=2594913 RepID=UPI00223A7551|nr:hypothetical protein [Corynebacterium sanguinis]MCT2287984.1 hypothetical protein [Corynebacterium sanguinis]
MTSIPPLKPQNPDSPSLVSGTGKKPRGADTMRYLVGSWSVMLLGELAHQLTNSIGLILDPSILRQAAAEAARNRDQEVSDAMLTVSTYTSIAVMTLFQLLIISLLAFALRAVARGHKWADAARRLLTVFSIFFVIRTLLVVIAPAAVAGATQLPLGFTAALGIAQIIVGVAAACALIYASRKEIHEALSNDTKKDG